MTKIRMVVKLFVFGQKFYKRSCSKPHNKLVECFPEKLLRCWSGWCKNRFILLMACDACWFQPAAFFSQPAIINFSNNYDVFLNTAIDILKCNPMYIWELLIKDKTKNNKIEWASLFEYIYVIDIITEHDALSKMFGCEVLHYTSILYLVPQ